MSGCVVWFCGLPASGKSTLARRVRERLVERARASVLLDGDEVRALLDPPPGHGEGDRDRFYRFLGDLAAHLAHQGLVVLVAATAHRRRWRDRARQVAPALLEVYVASDAATCRERDPKGLYRLAQEGEISGLPGVDVDFEAPPAPDVTARGGHDDEAVSALLALLGG